MRRKVSEHCDDVLVVVGLVILLCATYLGLGGAMALAFLGVIFLVTGMWVALLRNADAQKRDRER